MTSSSSSSSVCSRSPRRGVTSIGWDEDDDPDLRRRRWRSRSPEIGEDACESKMRFRRRALVSGSFKVMVPSSGKLLEETEVFERAVQEGREDRIRYLR